MLAGVAAAVLIAGGIAFRLISGPSGAGPPRNPRPRRPRWRWPYRRSFTGRPCGRVSRASALLFLGGDGLRLLSVGQRAQVSLTDAWPGARIARDPLGPDPAVQQVASVAGGVVALISSHGSAGLADVGVVLFIPVTGSGAGPPRVIARANYLALAPDHRGLWVEQAGPPGATGRADSPAWLIDEAGHRVSGPATSVTGSWSRPPSVACSSRDLSRALTLIDPADGRARPSGIPPDAIIAGADAGHVAWQPAFCTTCCPLHVTARGAACH